VTVARLLDRFLRPDTTATAAAPREDAQEYRHDLDGLRGMAIALVVAFHIWFGRVSGGVDVFLVLSGFFFTGSLLRGAEATGAVRVVTTARRLVRRLLPALVTVLAAVVAATLLLRPFTRWGEMAAQTLASLLYYQNWQLALSWSDYLAADPSVSPLQHLWSMSVQMQFYLLALLGVAAAARLCLRFAGPAALRPALAVVLAAGAVASFVYAAHGTAVHQGWNYYDSFARAWELSAGALLAVVAPWLSPPRLVRVAAAVLGSVGVLACGWLIDGADRFPGPAALVPVGAALALIVAGNNLTAAGHPLPNRLLAAPAAVRLGELSYALYLWHWPILIFALARTGAATAGLVVGLGVVGASLGLAHLTNRFVEEPLRMRSDRSVQATPARRRWHSWTRTLTPGRRHWSTERARPKPRCAPPCTKGPRTPPTPPVTAASRIGTPATSSPAPMGTPTPNAPWRWPAARTPSTGCPLWTRWAANTPSGSRST
jgi:peptidoglycan/LPS O-acetylase OafA/YrhL